MLFCVSEPNALIAYITSELCTEGKASYAGISPFKFLHDEPVSYIRHSSATVTGEVCAKQAEFRHFGYEVKGKCRASRLCCSMIGRTSWFTNLTHGLTHQPFVIIQQRIEV